MLLYDIQDFGGLEEYAATLAVSLQQQGHPTSVFSAAWAPPDNQYVTRLQQNGVAYFQMPKVLSRLASDWSTKEKILAISLTFLTPLVYTLGIALALLKKRSLGQALKSARNWLRGRLMNRLIGPDRRPFIARLFLNWWRMRWQPDVVHIHGYTRNLLFAIDWAHQKGVPVVYEEHQTPDSQFDWWQGFHQSVNKASMVVAVSEKSAQALHDICGVTRPIVVRSPLLPDPIGEGWRKNGRYSRGEQAIRLTTVARLYVTKGLIYLLDAIAKIREVHPTTEFRVYGDGPLRGELLAYAKQLGLDGEKIFPGAFTSRKELSQILSQTDIFVISSILEGQPLSLVEAMAFGCPVVSTNVGGIPELIEDKVNGLLCPPANADALAQTICVLIEDLELRTRLGYAARLTYEQGSFQPASICDQLYSVYEQALQQTGPR